jgi:hypothetical protein
MAADKPIKLMTVTVTSRPKTFRRCGREWAETPTTVEVTPEELAILQAEPMLVVVVNTPTSGAKNEAV